MEFDTGASVSIMSEEAWKNRFVKPDSTAKFFKLRPAPHALKGAFDQELDRLESMGYLKRSATQSERHQ